MRENDTTMRPLMPAPKSATAGLALALITLLGACSEPRAPTPPVAADPVTTTAPPSFLDEPPPPPVSDTIILSGGTLIGAEDQFDAVVVVQGTRVIAAGKRGTVPVPPDSIGVDTSGKFIVAVDPEQTLIGGPAELIVYDAHPSENPDATIHARVVAGNWQLTEP